MHEINDDGVAQPSMAALSAMLGERIMIGHIGPKPQPRKLSEIAAEIRSDWTKVYFGAEPYVEAMESLDSINDMYICERADSIVRYFLANAGTWRGETARRIKAELKSML